MIDLHIHTCFSDGEHTPQEIVNIAKSSGLDVIAITDHDRVEGIKEAIFEGNRLGVCVVPGIEITAFEDIEIHVLGYNIDFEAVKIKEYIKADILKRENDTIKIFEYLELNGVHLTENDVNKFRVGDFITVWHFARAICEKGYAKDVHCAIDRFSLGEYMHELAGSRISVNEAIKLIRDIGGVAVLAHPVRLPFSLEELIKRIKLWKSYGLSGIEAVYSLNSHYDTDVYLKLAKEYQLNFSIGSDYHGEHVKPDVFMGTGVRNSITQFKMLENEIRGWL